jgi:hypothetical protein
VNQGVDGYLVLANVLWPTPEFWNMYRWELKHGGKKKRGNQERKNARREVMV